jgi:hypothetical protein
MKFEIYYNQKLRLRIRRNRSPKQIQEDINHSRKLMGETIPNEEVVE